LRGGKRKRRNKTRIQLEQVKDEELANYEEVPDKSLVDYAESSVKPTGERHKWTCKEKT
jgi:hypothetical protein